MVQHSDGPASQQSGASETTPLLGTAAADPPLAKNDSEAVKNDSRAEDGVQQDTSSNSHVVEDDKPLPKKQIFLLCFARFIDPIAFFGIFPFVNAMIERVGNLDKADVGFYTGAIESAFSLTQMLCMISWGRAADRFGRKPILILCLSGLTISTTLFGFGRAIAQLFFLRCLSGIFAGSVVTVRAMISENSTIKTQAQAFSYYAFAGNIGIFLGNAIGGGFVNAGTQYPKLFGGVWFFKEFPYALPTIVIGIITALCTIICALYVKETLKRKSKSVEANDHAEADASPTTMEIIKAPGVLYVLFLYGYVMLLGLAYTAVVPLIFYTPPQLGGYGFSPVQIAGFLAAAGVSQSLWLLFAFPRLHKKFGTRWILKWCLIAWPGFFIVAPICNEFLRRDWRIAFWIVAPIFQITGSGVAMAFTGVQLALNDISPSPSSLGTLNGLSLSATSGIRTFAPVAFTSIFAAGVRNQFIHGHLVWVVLIVLGLLGSVTMRWFPDNADAMLKNREDTSEAP